MCAEGVKSILRVAWLKSDLSLRRRIPDVQFGFRAEPPHIASDRRLEGQQLARYRVGNGNAPRMQRLTVDAPIG
jgi:hypothetical protein